MMYFKLQNITLAFGDHFQTPPSYIILQNLHDVTPNVVAIAVIIERMSCKISFQVSFFIAV